MTFREWFDGFCFRVGVVATYIGRFFLEIFGGRRR